jgi:putative hydroxymethylpyrimidine transport system substrate-binding protein
VDQAIERAAFERTRPYFAQTQAIDQERWQTFADFALEHGLIAHPVKVATLLAP